MKLTVSGSPFSNHLDVSIQLAERFNCDFISAKSCLVDLMQDSPIDYYKCSVHSNLEDDNKLNSIIFKKIRSSQDYVADALLANVFSVDATKIFIYEDYTAHEDFCNAIIRDTLIESNSCKSFMEDYSDYRNYDIYFDGTGLLLEEKVDIIVKAMQYGFRGIIATKSSVLPVTMHRPMVECKQYTEVTPMFGVFVDNFLLVSNDVFYINDNSGKTPVFIDPTLPSPSLNYKVSNPMYYREWFKEVVPVDSHIVVKLMFYSYCKDRGLDSTIKEFHELAKNGSALRTLTKLGYLK